MSAPHPRASARAGDRQRQAAISIPTPLVLRNSSFCLPGQWKLATPFAPILRFLINAKGREWGCIPPSPPASAPEGWRGGGGRGAGCHSHTYPFGFAKSIILPPRTVETSDWICLDSPVPDKCNGEGIGMPFPLSLGLSPGRLAGRGREGEAGCHFHAYPFGFCEIHHFASLDSGN